MAKVFTVGHSTRSLDELTDLLGHHGVGRVVDVRTVPASRRMPHFSRAPLERALTARGIEYLHMPDLGGLRKPRPDSVNTGWRNASFRGFADYMQEDAFWRALERLEHVAVSRPTAIMCAEAVPWRCHRSLIADALTTRGDDVRHIIGRAGPERHVMTPFARVDAGRITYPGALDTLPL